MANGQPLLTQCVTWRNAFFGLVALFMAAVGYMAWADSNYVSVERYNTMEDDIRQIKECVINGKCRP